MPPKPFIFKGFTIIQLPKQLVTQVIRKVLDVKSHKKQRCLATRRALICPAYVANIYDICET